MKIRDKAKVRKKDIKYFYTIEQLIKHRSFGDSKKLEKRNENNRIYDDPLKLKAKKIGG